MRLAPSPYEELLWRALSGKKLGVAFRRQVPIQRFIADFLAPSAGFVIEVDGPYHAKRRSADRRRDEKLRRWGYRVLRLEAELVLRDLPAALALVAAELKASLGGPLRAEVGQVWGLPSLAAVEKQHGQPEGQVKTELPVTPEVSHQEAAEEQLSALAAEAQEEPEDDD
jgi:very-short-patch-repair endonuclease